MIGGYVPKMVDEHEYALFLSYTEEAYKDKLKKKIWGISTAATINRNKKLGVTPNRILINLSNYYNISLDAIYYNDGTDTKFNIDNKKNLVDIFEKEKKNDITHELKTELLSNNKYWIKIGHLRGHINENKDKFFIDRLDAYSLPSYGGNMLVCYLINYLEKFNIKLTRLTLQAVPDAVKCYLKQGFTETIDNNTFDMEYAPNMELNFDIFHKRCKTILYNFDNITYYQTVYERKLLEFNFGHILFPNHERIKTF